MPIYRNNRASDVKAKLTKIHNAAPTAHQAAAKLRMETAFKDLLVLAATGPNGRVAARQMKRDHKRFKNILSGSKDPNSEQVIHLLRIVLIPHLPTAFLGYDHGELHDIAPVVALLSQTEGKATYHVVTKHGLSDFLQKLSEDGWGPDTYPVPVDCEGNIAPVPRIKYGVYKHDLPQTQAQQDMEKKAIVEKFKQGIFDWEPTPFIQSDPNRRAGSEVYLHMNTNSKTIVPAFSMRDKNGTEVVERDITPDAHCHSAFADIMLMKDRQCRTRAIDVNTKILVRAAQYIIWAKRQGPANITQDRAETAPLDLTAKGLGLVTPVSHCDVFTEIAAGIPDAADRIDSNMATRDQQKAPTAQQTTPADDADMKAALHLAALYEAHEAWLSDFGADVILGDRDGKTAEKLKPPTPAIPAKMGRGFVRGSGRG